MKYATSNVFLFKLEYNVSGQLIEEVFAEFWHYFISENVNRIGSSGLKKQMLLRIGYISF